MTDISTANQVNLEADRLYKSKRFGDVTHTHLHQVELARRWRLSPRTLERWRWEGLGPQYLKVGGRVLYRIKDVEAFEAASLFNQVPNIVP